MRGEEARVRSTKLVAPKYLTIDLVEPGKLFATSAEHWVQYLLVNFFPDFFYFNMIYLG